MDEDGGDYPVKLSVLVVTYNHQNTIGEALESVFVQERNFAMEVVIADDHSGDQTLEIVQQFQLRYPGTINVLESTQNLGITRNYQRGFKACKGEYVAVLEGDDRWLGSDRLITLISFLDDHLECGMVFNRILLENTADSSRSLLQWETDRPYELVSGEKLAFENVIVNFSAGIYRTSVIRKLDDSIYDLQMYDWLFNLAVSRLGAIGYVPKVLSAYRMHEKGAWTGLRQAEKIEEVLGLIPVYDQFLHGVYSRSFKEHSQELADQLEYHRLLEDRRKKSGSLFFTLQVLFRRCILKLRVSLHRLTRKVQFRLGSHA